MNIVPSVIEQQVNRVDRQRSRYIGISSAVLAAWCVYRLIWAVYLSLTFGSFVAGALIFSIVLWGVIGVVAAIAATAFLIRAKQP
jgi:hypothetical protein